MAQFNLRTKLFIVLQLLFANLKEIKNAPIQ